jgi:phage head maturation protease
MADDPKKPYGDVVYADPGYQDDKKKRYPLDTEAHVRAAWSYISMPKNQEPYTAEQVAAIKGRIRAAAKKFDIELSESEDRNAMVPSVETRSDGVRIDGVDFGQRVITVLAVPYEQPTQVLFHQELYDEVFARSAFNGIESQTRKIPATAALEIPAANHAGGRLVGRVISSDPYREAGLVSEIKISRTDVGDDTLELAADEALWPSIGFMVKNPRFDQELDRYKKTRRVNRAFLDHLAFVGQPAYDGAKILAMRAAAEGAVFESEQEPLPATPRMDQFLNDPIMQWASERARQT